MKMGFDHEILVAAGSSCEAQETQKEDEELQDLGSHTECSSFSHLSEEGSRQHWLLEKL